MCLTLEQLDSAEMRGDGWWCGWGWWKPSGGLGSREKNGPEGFREGLATSRAAPPPNTPPKT
jgi:hypothetical protein